MKTVATVGTFDGVHRGHWAVLEEIARRAKESGRASVLVTFEPHPLEVVNPAAAPPLLTTAEEKRLFLAQTPIDRVAFVAFTEELRDWPPERFVREVLEGHFEVGELVIGYDHGFGRGRSGDVELLRRIGREDGFEVDVVPAVHLDGRAISSSLIRRAVAGGDLATAERALGRPYSVMGKVVRGAGRGRGIGVPTVNLAPPSPRKLLPPDGVYAVTVSWRGGVNGGMANLGARPTFGDHARTLEAHLFGFSGELYDEMVTIEFIARLRETMRFATPEELGRQLEEDRDRAVEILRRTRRPVTL